MLTFPASMWASGVRLQYITNVSSASDLTTYTFSSTSIGTAASDRYIIVSASLRSSAVRTFSSVTLGGSAMAQLVATDGAQTCIGIWGLHYPTGTTADIAVTMSGGAGRCATGVWAVYGLNSLTPIDTSTSSASPMVLDVNTTPGCVVIGAAYTAGTTGETFSGISEDFDAVVEGAHSPAGSDMMSIAETPRTIRLTLTGATTQNSVCVSLI